VVFWVYLSLGYLSKNILQSLIIQAFRVSMSFRGIKASSTLSAVTISFTYLKVQTSPMIIQGSVLYEYE